MPRRDPLDAVVGAIAGLLFGGTSVGLVALNLIPEGHGLFLIAIVILSSIVCAAIGYWKGNDFFRWLRDHWFDW